MGLAGLHIPASLFGVVVACGDAADPGRIHGAWRDAVDPHAFFYVVDGGGAGDREDRALRCAVDGPVGYPDERGHRRHVDNRPTPCIPYSRDGVLHPEERSPEAHVHHPLIIFFLGLGGGTGHAYSRVVDNDVEAAPLFPRGLNQRLDLAGVGDVCLADEGLAVGFASCFGRHARGRLPIHVRDDYSRSLLDEPEGDGTTDARAGARYYGPLSSQACHLTPRHFRNGQYNGALTGGANATLAGKGATVNP